MIRRLGGDGTLSMAPTGGGIQCVPGELASFLATMLARREHTRVKICANPDCGWVMYDESRNQTRRWCSASECGNLIKGRRFRRNKRGSGS